MPFIFGNTHFISAKEPKEPYKNMSLLKNMSQKSRMSQDILKMYSSRIFFGGKETYFYMALLALLRI